MVTSSHPYALGWDLARATSARQKLLQTGRLATVLPGIPAPSAWSLAKYRLAHYEQGQCGSCWLHAAKQCVEVSANALGYTAFPVCRHLIGYLGKSFEGGGSPCNGGSVADALSACLADHQGGLAHEDLDPYHPDGSLAQRPPKAVWDDATKSHLVAHVDVKSDDEARTLISSGRPCANGIWWPYGWDNGRTFMDSIGPGTYGHALLEIGYVQAGVFDDHAWFQLDNWHGLLYPPLPEDKAAKVPGYVPIQPDKTSDFWVRADVYEAVRNKGFAERLSATDFTGLGNIVTIPSFLDAFPV